jgi:hypothetical protein
MDTQWFSIDELPDVSKLKKVEDQFFAESEKSGKNKRLKKYFMWVESKRSCCLK